MFEVVGQPTTSEKGKPMDHIQYNHDENCKCVGCVAYRVGLTDEEGRDMLRRKAEEVAAIINSGKGRAEDFMITSDGEIVNISQTNDLANNIDNFYSIARFIRDYRSEHGGMPLSPNNLEVVIGSYISSNALALLGQLIAEDWHKVFPQSENMRMSAKAIASGFATAAAYVISKVTDADPEAASDMAMDVSYELYRSATNFQDKVDVVDPNGNVVMRERGGQPVPVDPIDPFPVNVEIVMPVAGETCPDCGEVHTQEEIDRVRDQIEKAKLAGMTPKGTA